MLFSIRPIIMQRKKESLHTLYRRTVEIEEAGPGNCRATHQQNVDCPVLLIAPRPIKTGCGICALLDEKEAGSNDV